MQTSVFSPKHFLSLMFKNLGLNVKEGINFHYLDISCINIKWGYKVTPLLNLILSCFIL